MNYYTQGFSDASRGNPMPRWTGTVEQQAQRKADWIAGARHAGRCLPDGNSYEHMGEAAVEVV